MLTGFIKDQSPIKTIYDLLIFFEPSINDFYLGRLSPEKLVYEVITYNKDRIIEVLVEVLLAFFSRG